MGGSTPGVHRLAHDLETAGIAVLDPPPALHARFEAGVSQLISDEQRRRNAPLRCGRFAASRCGPIGWLWRRRLATGERDRREREPGASGGRNPLASPVRERWVL
jgi:hypothetical protein